MGNINDINTKHSIHDCITLEFGSLPLERISFLINFFSVIRKQIRKNPIKYRTMNYFVLILEV